MGTLAHAASETVSPDFRSLALDQRERAICIILSGVRILYKAAFPCKTL
jgi:hypothetical protein